MQKILNKLFSRLVFVALFMLLQIGALVVMLVYFRSHFALFYVICEAIAVIFVIYIIAGNSNPAYKIAWIIPILSLPVFGNLLYLMFRQYQTPAQRRRMEEIRKKSAAASGALGMSPPVAGTSAARQSEYIRAAASAPAHKGTSTEFLPLGDVMFPRMLREIEKAKRYIFVEYFILARGEMLTALLDALERKAAEGVDVRVIYDDLGSITTVPKGFDREMEKRGIKCRVFRRFKPVLSGSFNTRDHRKILVVDGVVGFTGGINIGDEYINRLERFGHWQDCGVMLKGRGVWNFVIMFMAMWDALSGGDEDYLALLPREEELEEIEDDGIVQPYSDEPGDEEPVGENAYIGVIAKARRYVWICTPYLVIDNELTTALCSAARGGVDVRIMTPGIPDKSYVFAVTRSCYYRLIRAGVKIFEYSPGFLHSKICIADDEYAICGTINFDYRSLYLHHECAVWMYRSSAVVAMRDHYRALLEQCAAITPEWCESITLAKRIVQSLLRVFSPMM